MLLESSLTILKRYFPPRMSRMRAGIVRGSTPNARHTMTSIHAKMAK